MIILYLHSTKFFIFFFFLGSSVADVDKLGLETSTADQEAVDVGLRAELARIRAGHRAAVQDASGLGHLGAHVVGEPFAQLGVNLLGLGWRGRLARADRPHRLVRDHHSTPVVNVIFHSDNNKQPDLDLKDDERL